MIPFTWFGTLVHTIHADTKFWIISWPKLTVDPNGQLTWLVVSDFLPPAPLVHLTRVYDQGCLIVKIWPSWRWNWLWPNSLSVLLQNPMQSNDYNKEQKICKYEEEEEFLVPDWGMLKEARMLPRKHCNLVAHPKLVKAAVNFANILTSAFERRASYSHIIFGPDIKNLFCRNLTVWPGLSTGMYFEGFDSSEKLGTSRLKLQPLGEMLNN